MTASTFPAALELRAGALRLALRPDLGGAIAGFGGCPMAEDDLVGNLTTELFVRDMEERGVRTGLDLGQLDNCVRLAGEVFPT